MLCLRYEYAHRLNISPSPVPWIFNNWPLECTENCLSVITAITLTVTLKLCLQNRVCLLVLPLLYFCRSTAALFCEEREAVF